MISASHRTTALALLVAAFMVLGTQADLLPLLTWHDQQRIAQTALLAVLLVVTGASCRDGIHVDRRVLMALAAVAFAGALSAAWAPLPRWAWIEWSLLVSLVTCALLVGMLRRNAGLPFDATMTWLVCAICAVFAIRFLATYVAGAAAGAELDTRELSSLGFSNRRFFGQLQTLTLPLAALPVLLVRTRRARIAAFMLLAAWWMLAFVSATRGTFLAMAVAVPFAGLWSGLHGRRWLRVQAGGFAAGVALYALLMLVLPGLLGIDFTVESRWTRLLDSSGRLQSWAFTLDTIRSHPLLGVGPMHLAYWLNPDVPVAHPHNALLQVAAEWGVPAALLASGVVLYAFARFAGAFRGTAATALTAALLAALSGSAIQSMVDGVLVMPVPQTLLALMGGWALGVYWQQTPRAGATHGIRVPGCALTLLLACTAGVLAHAAVRDVPLLRARQDAHVAEHSAYLHPRYWQQGWIGEPQRDR